MLQQTTVTAVIPYFERWMRVFPTVAALAKADEQEVLHLWQGLGYYSRARNLHKAAKAIVERHQGLTPVEEALLRELPGVGEYTAAAVAAFAGDTTTPVIDANIARVLARLANIQEPIDTAKGRALLREASAELLPLSGGRMHSSALMDLGATICTARAPKCVICPVNAFCEADEPDSLPRKRARAAVTQVQESRSLVLHRGQLVLLLSHGPRWKGMWLLPEWTGPEREPDLVEMYPITRFKVTMNVFRTLRKPLDGEKAFPVEALPPMPSPHRRVIEKYLSGMDENG